MDEMDYRPLPEPVTRAVIDAMQRLGVPGAAAGVLFAGEVYAEGFGITNVDHPLPVTPETLFQIGSTSKTVTATVLMQLVEEGSVDLDQRVRHYLPGFRLQSEADAGALTLRHLVTHHGGWVGDYFRDTGRGDDAIARIVEKMANSRQIVPAGTAFSYNNAGFYVLARIIEVLEGRPFEHVVRERVFQPLGMERSFYFPEEALPHRVAAGHTVTVAGPRVVAPWNVARSIAGGGGVISTALDQVRYARFHCGDGLAPGGARLLGAETMALMQTPQARAGSMCDHIGVAWMIDGVGAGRVVKHGGATYGHLSSFDLVPGRQFGCTILTNADAGRGVRQAFYEACLSHFLGIEPAEPLAIAASPGGLAEYAGTYRATLATIRLEMAEGHLAALEEERAPRPGQPVPLPPVAVQLRPVGVDQLAVIDGPRRGERCEFVRDATGAIAFMRWDGRLARREA